MFDALRALPAGDVVPVRVRVVKDLFWSDGEKTHPHAKTGEEGEIFARTGAGFLVRFDSGEIRQVADFQGEEKLYRAEDEITLV